MLNTKSLIKSKKIISVQSDKEFEERNIDENMKIEQTAFSHEIEHLIIGAFLGFIDNSHHDLMKRANLGMT